LSPEGPRLVIVGPPGSGKTTVATLLAERLDVDVRDTDADVESATGMAVADIFIEKGESAFRELEEEAVAKALVEHAGVLALGGGAVLSERTREALRPHRVVYLEVGLAAAVQRVGLGVGRPLLLGNVRSTLKRLLDERAPLYRAVADITIKTDGVDPAVVVDRVMDELRGDA
jgi:shikimate kinase